MRAFGAAVIVMALIGWWIFVASYATVDTAKRLSTKEGREEIKESTKSIAKTVSSDKDFHRELKSEFKPQIIFFSVLAFVLILSALFGFD